MDPAPQSFSKPLRALIEFDGDELRIFPICDTDRDEARILNALRLMRKEAHSDER